MAFHCFIFSPGQRTQKAGLPFMTICMQASPQFRRAMDDVRLPAVADLLGPLGIGPEYAGQADQIGLAVINRLIRKGPGGHPAGGNHRYVHCLAHGCGQIQHVAFLL